MNKFFFITIFIPFILIAETENLSKKHFALKMAELTFQSSLLEEEKIERGLYFGIEGALKISKRTFFTMEIGYLNSSGTNMWKVKNEIIFIPLELNLKHRFNIAKRLNFNIGYGLMDSYVKFKSKYDRELDRSAGFQVFFDVNYNFKKSYIGITLKKQIMFSFGKEIHKREELGNSDYNNYRIGIIFGYFL